MLYNEIMGKKKYYLKAAAILLSAAVLLTGILPERVMAAENTAGTADEKTESSGDVIEISDADDLMFLSKKSTNEAETMGKTYVITRDISLENVDYQPVSIFAGTLDGQGYSITGLNIGGNVSLTGLVRSVGETACIRNLCVSGNVAPEGVMKEIGGVAGRNYGTLENVTFSGYVLGTECVGGLVGHNMDNGKIISCTSDAAVLGTRRTGGIAGFNEGTIRDSKNNGRINAEKTTAWETDDNRKTEHQALEADDMEELDDTNENLAKLNPDLIDLKDDDVKEKVSDGQKINYTGGIAGASSGTIENCENNGTVGYNHTGYKTGGIVGYERGILTGCRNNGEVFGRKDVGGITGQFEPYMLNAYSEDSFTAAEKQLDDLVDMTDRLHKTVGHEDDKAQSNIDAIRGTADDLRQTVSDYKTYYQCKNDSVEKEIRSQVDGIRGVLDEIDPDVYEGKTKNALQGLKDTVGDLEKLLDSAEEAAGSGLTVDMTNYLDKILKVLSSGNESMSDLMGQAAKGAGKLEKLGDQLSDIRDKSGALDDYLRGCIDDYKKDIRETDDDITGKTDNLAAQMDTLSDGLKGSDASIRNQLNTISDQMQTINGTLDDGFDEVKQELETIRETENADDVFDDVSDDPDRTPAKGSIISSVNNGKIDADYNAGGIVGIMDYDYDTQSDFEVVSQGKVSLNYKRTKKATVIDCTNNADVSVRNDYAGGIVGRAEMGAVLSGNNFGRIESREGDFAGGIAGKSDYVIRSSYSMSEVSGNSNVGGIAGYASILTDSACLSNVGGTREKLGAVAGEADPEGTIKDNIFVQNGLGAIDGSTVEAQAKPVKYSDLLAEPMLPTEFRQMKVRFEDDGKVVKTIMVRYGRGISLNEYPELPSRDDGRFGYWENIDLSDVKQNTTVHSVYVDFVTTIATEEAIPKLLITGDFYDNSSVKLVKTEAPAGSVPGYSVVDAYSYSVEGKYGKLHDDYVLRFLADEYGKDAAVAVMDEGGLAFVDSSRDGNYLVFSMKGDGEFVILKKNHMIRNIILGCLAVILLIGVVLLIIKKHGSIKRDPEDYTDGRKKHNV